jgi:hypothetical protein
MIGAFLDLARARAVSIIQLDDRLLARYYASGGGEMQVQLFSPADLDEDQGAEASGKREAGRRGSRNRSSYENVLRALGWELDQAAAASITVDEVDADFHVSWLTRDPVEGLMVVKRHALVRRSDLESILRDARARRGTGILDSAEPVGEEAIPAGDST